MPTSPPPDDTPKPRLRGDMYLRAEQRYLAEVAAARLLETTTPLASPPGRVRPPEAIPVVSAQPETIAGTADPSDLIKPADASPAPAASPPDVMADPLASFPRETRPRAVPRVKPTPVQISRAVAQMTRDKRAIVPATALGVAAIGMVAIVLTLSSGSDVEAPEVTQLTASSRDGASASAPAHAETVDVPTAAPAAVPTAGPSVAPTAGQPSSSQATPVRVPSRPARSQAISRATRVAETSPVVPATGNEGQIRITSTPAGARVTINGIGWGQTPLTIGHLPLGTKTVRVTRDGYKSAQRSVDLRGDSSSAAVHLTLRRAE